MGKYIRKAKLAVGAADLAVGAADLAVGAADLAVMETSLGVRTRAKTLAAKIQPVLSPVGNSSASSYLQLRSRRLLKPPVSVPTHYSKRQKQSTNQTTVNPNPNNNPNTRASSRLRMASSESVGSYLNNSNSEINSEGVKTSRCEESIIQENENSTSRKCDLGGACLGEASFGENVLENSTSRTTRESTPTSFIRDPDVVQTPGPTSLTGSRWKLPDSNHRHILTSDEMDEFFASAEEEQHKKFIAKYNFDPANEKPLPGRYEWEQLDPPDTK